MARVCVLLPGHWDSAKGGAEYQAHLLARHLAATTAHEVVYLTRDASRAESGHTYQLRKVPAISPHHRFGLFWDSPSLYWQLRHLQPDVVVQGLAGAYTGVAAKYCRDRRIPLIWQVASDMDVAPPPRLQSLKRLPRWIDRKVFEYGMRNASHVIAQTRWQAEMLCRNYSLSATAVIPNWHEIPPKTWQKAKDFTVLWIANLKRLKQPEIFVRLAADLGAVPGLVFKMIGRPEDSQWCRHLLSQVSMLKNLSYLGEKSNEEVNRQLEVAHVLVNSSLYEGFSNTFIQAWMREVAVLSLNADPDGVIEAHGLGACTRGAYEMLRRELVNLVTDRQRLEGIAQRSRAFASTAYSMKNADAVAGLIDKVVETGDRGVMSRPDGTLS